MRTALRKMGNSTGMIVPKPLLDELGLASGAAIELRVEDGRLVGVPERPIRDGWAAAAAATADEDDPDLDDWLGFGVKADEELDW